LTFAWVRNLCMMTSYQRHLHLLCLWQAVVC